MKDDRLRVPMEDAYLHAIGLAMLCFALLEWSAVYCCEKINSGYLNNVALKTAGQIANDLIGVAENHPSVAIRLSLGVASANFQSLVKQRNDLVHANPGTANCGKQRLFRHGEQWTVDLINDLADRFVEASVSPNNHYHYLL